MKDSFGRNINYLRISITDRCNLRCRYCMPSGVQLLPSEDILSYEEIIRVCQAAAQLGITRFKITGGEPLSRLGCPELIGKLKSIPGVEQVTLTTNGLELEKYLPQLLDNGLDAVNISLDTMDPIQFHQITGRKGLHKVLGGIDKAAASGLKTKVNSVMLKGITVAEPGKEEYSQWKPLAELAAQRPIDVRFIEMMPIGYGKQFPCLSALELASLLFKAYPGAAPDTSIHGNGPAVYYRIPGFQGSIGFISAIHGKFCGSCNRIRMTAQGELKPCLCYENGVDLKPVLREEQKREDSSARLVQAIEEAVAKKPVQHCFEDMRKITETRKMVQIGG